MNRIIKTSSVDQLEYEVLEFVPTQIEQIVLIVHGMQDYKERYIEFAGTLENNNCLVLIPDLRGHGINPSVVRENNFIYQLHDLDDLINKYYNKDVTLFGHSMGSLLVRAYLKRYPRKIKRAILSGSPSYDKLIPIVRQLLKMTKGLSFTRNYKSRLLHKLVIESFNQKTNYDWLSYNQKNVDDYINSPYCGVYFTNQQYQDLFELMMDVNDTYKTLMTNAEVTLLTGADDPVAKNVDEVESLLNDWGFRTNQIVYPNSRHEILFDNEKEMVIKDILAILGK